MPAPAPSRATPEDVAEHVASRAGSLQHQARRSVPSAVAALARLRRGIGKEPGEQIDLLSHTHADAFAPRDGGDAPTPEERASHLALTLFALHQQSQSEPMHRSGRGLGAALRALAGPGDVPEAVLSRFRILGTSDSFAELTHHLRGAVQLLRQGRHPLDYGLLADQLVRWQRFPDGPSRVRLAWGREFHRTPKPSDKNIESEGSAP